MIDAFNLNGYVVISALRYQHNGSGIGEFTYALGWFENSGDTVAPTDLASAITSAGFTQYQDELVLLGNEVFNSSPSFQLSESLARADAVSAIGAVAAQLTLLGY